MFTVCPKCMLTLAVTANDLRMGQGYVRCGRCANVFNALLTLSEEPTEEHESSPPTPADRASQSQIAAALRQPPAPAPAAPPPGPPPSPAANESRSQVDPVDGPSTQLPTEQSSDGSIENESNRAEGTGTFETIVLEGDAITQTEEFVPEESVDSEIASLTQRLERTTQEPLATPVGPAVDAAVDDSSGTESESGLRDLEPAPERGGTAPRAVWPWTAGIIALSLLLVLQVIHHWRDTLASSSMLGAPLLHVYTALGMSLDPHWDLSAYDVRQQGASADPADSQLIRVRLSLANHAPRAQPLPLLRLTLLDRYGKRIATSDLSPEQYWPGGAPPAALSHDERVDSQVTVRDPSASSASFELDVCLRSARGALRCAGELPPK